MKALFFACLFLIFFGCQPPAEERPVFNPDPVKEKKETLIEDEIDEMFVLESEEGNFESHWPKQPSLKTEAINSAAGFIKLNFYKAELSNGLVYTLSYSDYPIAVLKSVSSDQMIETASKGLMKTLDMPKYIMEEDVEMQKFPGKKILIANQDSTSYSQHCLYMVKNRMYQLSLIGTKNRGFTSDFNDFIQSFRLREEV